MQRVTNFFFPSSDGSNSEVTWGTWLGMYILFPSVIIGSIAFTLWIGSL